MEVLKVCMECGHEFEENILHNDRVHCPLCLSGDIHEPEELEYEYINLEECFVLYHSYKIASECNADKKMVCFMEE